MIPNTNDDSGAPPRVALFLNLNTLADLPEDSGAPTGEGKDLLLALKQEGYEGVQVGDPAVAGPLGMKTAAFGRFDRPGELAPVAEENIRLGFDCLTLHVGNGFESDAEAIALFEEVVKVSSDLNYPIYLETHRATVTQDPWRTVQFTNAVPDIRFNGDFSHWYTGTELPYGNLDWKLDFMQPVFDRVRFMHGRIGNASNMQVDVQLDREGKSIPHFREIWTRSLMGFLREAGPGDYLAFAPEILPPLSLYARTFEVAPGVLREESNRWQQAQVYNALIQQCLEEARRRLA